MLFSQKRRRPTDRSGHESGLLAAAALPATAAVVPTAAAFPSPTAAARPLTSLGPVTFSGAVQVPVRRSRVDPNAGALTAETIVTVGG